MLAKLPKNRARLIRWTAVLAGFGIASCLVLQACNGSEPPVDTSPVSTHPVSTGCDNPATGCPCTSPGDTAACGSTVAGEGGQTQCMAGSLTCNGGVWGSCVPTFTQFVTLKKIKPAGVRPTPQLLSNDAASGEAGACDPCDPYCESFNGDNSNGVDGGPGLLPINGGWTLADATPPADVDICTGNQCYVANCDAGQTELVGKVLDPAGHYPVNNALVMIPNDGIIPTMTDGVHFDPCSGTSLPPGLAVTTTGPDGVFVLGNSAADGGGSVPIQALPIQVDGGGDAGAGPVNVVPILIQVGRWRRLVTVNVSQACVVNDAGPITLPSVQGGDYGQDNIPHVAIITGACDPFECMINTIGVDRTQFSQFGGGGRIELLYAYNQGTGNGAGLGTVNSGANTGLPPAIIMLPDGGFPDAATSGYDQLLTSGSVVDNYDLVMLPCRCGQEYEGPSAYSASAGAVVPTGNYTDPTTATDYDDQLSYRQTLLSYANSGGRVFTSHWGREWIERQALSFDAGPGGCVPEAGACLFATADGGSAVTMTTCQTNPACVWSGGCAQTAACPNGTTTTSVSCGSVDGGGGGQCGWSGLCGQTTACPLDAGTTSGLCTGADPQCQWTGSCTAPSCPVDAGTTQAQCVFDAGGVNLCTWSGTCAAPACPEIDGGITAVSCAIDGGAAGNLCSWGGSCSQQVACAPHAGNSAACNQLDAGGDPQCTWTASSCSQTTACPIDAGTVTSGNCTTADPQCVWGGSCAAPACPGALNVDGGTLAGACGSVAGCSFTGSCSVATATGTCPTHPSTVAGCTSLVSGGDPQCTWANNSCSQIAACPNTPGTTAPLCNGDGGGDPQCNFTGSCSAPACPVTDASTTNVQCNAVTGCDYTGTCAINGVCGANTSASTCTNAGANASSCTFTPLCAITNNCPSTANGGGTGVTASSCRTVGSGGDPECVWTGSCSSATCPSGTNVDGGSGAGACGASAGCAFTGSCGLTSGSCPTHAGSITACQTGPLGDPQCGWTNGACTQPTSCPATGTTNHNTCMGDGGGDQQCNWTGSCSAPVCSGSGFADASTCTATTGCNFTGSCGQVNSCSLHAASSNACTSLDAGGDPACNWSGTACTITNACQTSGGTVTAAQCTQLDAGGDPQCGWTGSCTVPTCPSGAGIDAGTCLNPAEGQGGSSACQWSGACSLTASCPTNPSASQTSCSGACNFDAGPSGGNGCTGAGAPACATALAGDGGAACTAAGCFFDAGTPGGNGCTGSLSSTCTPITVGTTCTSSGCLWGGGCTSKCFSYIDSASCNGTLLTDAGAAECHWSTDGTGCKPVSGVCTGATSAACVSTGLTCVFDGCTPPSCSAAVNVTANACTTLSDGGPTGCLWAGSCAAPSCPTDAGANQTSCQSAGCTWTGSCATNASACTTQVSEATCGAIGDGGGVGCHWGVGVGAAANGCTTVSDAGGCATAGLNGENACSAAGCNWDGGANVNGCSMTGSGCAVLNASQSACTVAADGGSTGCSWDVTDASTCTSGGACGVSAVGSQSACTGTTGCVWDAGTALSANGCADPDAGSCAGQGSMSLCGTNNCVWDAGGAVANGCQLPGGGIADAGCTSLVAEQSEAGCAALPGCAWNTGFTTCSGGAACTSAATESACGAVGGGGCTWDGGASGFAGNGCSPAGDASACTSATSEGACTGGCAWDGGGASANGCTLGTDNCGAQTANIAACQNYGDAGECKWTATCVQNTNCTNYFPLSEAVCKGAAPQSDGGTLVGCAFAPGAAGALTNGCAAPTGCTTLGSVTTCTALQAGNATCLWDGGGPLVNGCQLPPGGTDAGCLQASAEQSQSFCAGLAGCQWDPTDASTCTGGGACSVLASNSTCNGLVGCAWDAGASTNANGCSGGSTATCGDAGTKATCTLAIGCVWDAGASGVNGNGCYSTQACTGVPAQVSAGNCAAVDGGGCSWDVTDASTCTSGSACTLAPSLNGCNGVAGGGCVWDGGGVTANGCSGATAALCDAGSGNQATCVADKCIWGGGCSGSSVATCGDAGTSETACLGASCSWDGGSAPNGCASSGYCGLSATGLSQANCVGGDGGDGCSWTGGCTTNGACGDAGSQGACGNPSFACTWSGACSSTCSGPTPSLCNSITSCMWTGSTGTSSTGLPFGWAPFPGVAVWEADNDSPGSGAAYFNSTPGFSRGDELASWLTAIGVNPDVSFTVGDPKTDVYSLPSTSANFVYGWEPSGGGPNIDAGLLPDAGGPDTIYSFTFDPSDGGADGGTAGRVMFTDMHLSTNLQTAPAAVPAIQIADKGGFSVSSPVFNTSYTAGANIGINGGVGVHECLPPEGGLLSAEEKAAEYLLFDLGACQAIGLPPGFVPQQYFATEVFTRDYCVAPSGAGTTNGCPVTCQTPNSAVVWRDWVWQSIIPGEADGGVFGPSIDFSFQTANTEAELGPADGGAGASPNYSLPTPDTTSSPVGHPFSYDVNTLLGTGNSQTWLRVTMTLNPDSTHQVAPTLASWAQQFDCVPAQ